MNKNIVAKELLKVADLLVKAGPETKGKKAADTLKKQAYITSIGHTFLLVLNIYSEFDHALDHVEVKTWEDMYAHTLRKDVDAIKHKGYDESVEISGVKQAKFKGKIVAGMRARIAVSLMSDIQKEILAFCKTLGYKVV